MDQTDALKSALRGPSPAAASRSKRAQRADRTRAKALSPVRILLSVLLIPVVAASLTVSIYIRTSPYEPPDALRHLIALSGCEAAAKVGVAPAYQGQPGYHVRNDPDGDGVACGSARVAFAGTAPARAGAAKVAVEGPQDAHVVGGAKFVRP